MKLIRFGLPGEEKPGVVTDAGMFDVSAFGEDYGERFFETDGINRLKSWYASHAGECPKVPEGTRLGSPLQRPSKIICIGLNYADHAKETGAATPAEPGLPGRWRAALGAPLRPGRLRLLRHLHPGSRALVGAHPGLCAGGARRADRAVGGE